MKKLFFFLLVISFAACKKDTLPTNLTGEDTTNPTNTTTLNADDRDACNLTLTPTFASSSTWEANLWGKINGVWTMLQYIGGPGSNATVKIPTGSFITIPLNAYVEFQLVQLNYNTTYRLQSPAGTINKQVYSNSSFSFRAGCAPLPECSMTLRVGNACETTWDCNIFRKDAANNDVLFAHVGGLGSTAPIKIPTGGIITLPINGYSQYTFTQHTGTTNYIINAPNTGQFTFSLDVTNGASCFGASLPGSQISIIGCQ